jgi:PAS domain S-box-containing protein
MDTARRHRTGIFARHRQVVRIVAIYVMVSGLWILLSDRAVGCLTSDPALMTTLSTIKGFLFIVVTATLLYVLILRLVQREGRIREELRGSEERYRSLVAASPMGLHTYQLQEDGGLILDGANPAAEDLLGHESWTTTGHLLEDVLPALAEPEALAHLRRIATTGGTWSVSDLRHREGEVERILDVHAFRTADRRLAVSFLDVTARRRAEVQRDLVFDRSLDLLCIAGFDGRFIQVNPAWSAALGRSVEEMRAQPWITFVHPEDQEATRAMHARLQAGGEVRRFENRCVAKDGSHRCLSWNAYPLPAERIIIAVVRDITEQVRIEEELRQAQKMDAIGQLAGGVAHDFNNMLAGILGYAELLAQRLSHLGEADRPLRAIIATATRAAELTGKLLAFSRKGRRSSQPFDAHEVVRSALDLLRHGLDPRIVVRCELSARRVRLVGDAGLVQNAVLNLGLNARDAMPDGGVLTVASADVELAEGHPLLAACSLRPGCYWHLAVADNGCGMSPEVRHRAFEPFFTTKGQGKGTGLGLSSVYGTVRSHDGGIALVSEPGHGTTVDLYLPVLDAPPVERAPSMGPMASIIAGGCVLVIEDEPTMRGLAVDMLTDLGCQTLTAVDGAEGVAVFAQEHARIRLVILDMVMPRLNGRDALRAIRSIDPQAVVLMWSGYVDDVSLDALFAEGLAGFIQKPFPREEFIRTLTRLLDPPSGTRPAVR